MNWDTITLVVTGPIRMHEARSWSEAPHAREGWTVLTGAHRVPPNMAPVPGWLPPGYEGPPSPTSYSDGDSTHAPCVGFIVSKLLVACLARWCVSPKKRISRRR